jgi:NAD(P)H-dependent FMN reductase
MSEEIATVDGQAREPVSFLVFSASLREGSLNTQLADLAAGAIESNRCTVVSGTMAEFDCPSYDADVQREQGFPPGAEELRRRLEASDAFVISSPEYNASMPGLLKNAVDWVSRFHPQPFHERHALLLSASPSMVGGNRGVWALRVPFEHLDARIYPDMFSLARPPRPGRQRGDRRRGASATLPDDDRQLHRPRRGVQALSVRQKRMGGVPRRASRAGDRPLAVTRSC